MDEQEKNHETISYEKRLAKAMESLKGMPLPTDTDPTSLFWGMKPVPDRFKKNSERSECPRVHSVAASCHFNPRTHYSFLDTAVFLCYSGAKRT